MKIGLKKHDGPPPEPRDASTVVLLRDGEQGPETLLLRRSKDLVFAAGVWVFPGGAVDQEDRDAAGGELVAATRIAALREAREEAAVAGEADSMVQLSHWTTPAAESRRFSTWFYVARAEAGAIVEIDGSEIHDSAWYPVREAIARHEAGELGLYPPTWLTLHELSRFDSVEGALSYIATITPPRVLPVIGFEADKLQLMFAGDAGYESGEASRPGARHRVVFSKGAWKYLHQPLGEDFARLDRV